MSKFCKYNFCLSSFLYNHFQSYKDKIIVIDTRDTYNYLDHNLSGSINISHDQVQEYISKKGQCRMEMSDITLSDLAEIMNEEELLKFNQRKRSYCILIVSETNFPIEFLSLVQKLSNAYELVDYFEISQEVLKDELNKVVEKMEEKEAVALGLKIFDLLIKDKARESYVLLDGAEMFFNIYPFMNRHFHNSPFSFIRSKSTLNANLDVTFNFPNDILCNRLFLGTYNQASQDIIVDSLNITHIVNVTAECTNVHEQKGIKYLHIIILDETEVCMTQFFKEAYEFIESALESDKSNKVLLHCALGKSRSATITIMFLMKKFAWPFDKALEYVKMRRRIVDPNYGFLKQLEDFEKCQHDF